MVQATTSSVVPPGSANPTQGGGPGVQGGGGKMILPKKVVTLETVRDRGEGREARGESLTQADAEVAKEETKQSSNQTIKDPVPMVDASPSAVSSLTKASGQATPSADPDDATTQQITDATVDDEDIELPDLTPEQLAFLTSERYQEASSMIKREFGMEDDDLSFLSEMEHAVLGGVINLEQFIIALRGEFPNLNDAEKNRLIGILLAYRFEPFAEQLKPTPVEAARTQNIKLATAPYYRIYSKPLTFRGAAHEVARMAGIDLMGQAQERLRDAIVSRMKGIRTDGQIEELFMRPPEQTGLGLPEEKARIARESLVELIGRAQLLGEDEYAKWLNDQIHHKQAKTVDSTATAVSTSPLQDAEDKEIADIARRMPVTREVEETVLMRSTASVIKNLSWKPTDDYLMRRLENTISTRLRDVRSRNEVFIKLMRDDKVGGLGLDRKQAEKIAEEIEQGYQTYRTAVSGEEKDKLKTQLVEQEQKVEERKRRDAEAHAKWFEEKIKGKQDSAKSGLELLRVIARGQTTPIHPLDAKETANEKASFGDLVEATQSGARPEAVNAMRQLSNAFKDGKGATKKAGTNKVSAVPTSLSPAPNKPAVAPMVKVSVETARVAQKSVGSTKPKMQDVTPMNKTGMALSGPLQEIGQMTLEHFRRLASDPKMAAKRVLDIADVLGHESYERRIAATEAWKSSPLQRMYIELVTSAFLKKKSVTEVANDKRTAGGQAPTPEEIMAIIDLNRSLSL